MNFKKITALVLALVLTASVAGCSTDKSWVAQLGEEKISAGVYALNLLSGLSAASAATGVGTEPDKNEIFAADIEGKTGSQYIIEYATNESMRQLATCKKFTELGLTISDEEKKNYEDYGKQMYSQDTDMFTANGISEQSLIDYNRYSFQAYKVFEKIYGPEGEKAATADDMNKYFADSYYTAYIVPYLKVDGNTGAPLEGEALAKMNADADAAYKAIEGGKNITDVIHEVSMAQLPAGTAAPEKGKDSDYIMVIDKVDTGYFPALLTQFMPTATIGKLSMIEDEQYKLIVQKLDETKTDGELAKYYYMQALPNMKQKEFTDLCLEWSKPMGITFNAPALKDYTGEKIKKNTDAYIKKAQAALSSSSVAANSSMPAETSSVPAETSSAAPESVSGSGASK